MTKPDGGADVLREPHLRRRTPQASPAEFADRRKSILLAALAGVVGVLAALYFVLLLKLLEFCSPDGCESTMRLTILAIIPVVSAVTITATWRRLARRLPARGMATVGLLVIVGLATVFLVLANA